MNPVEQRIDFERWPVSSNCMFNHVLNQGALYGKAPQALSMNRYNRITLRLITGNGDKAVTYMIHLWQH